MVILQGLGGDRRAADGERGILGEGQAHLELGCLDIEALVPQRLRYVVDARVVAGGAQRRFPPLSVGDVLQRFQVRHHRVARHAVPQPRGVIGRRAGSRRWRRRLGGILGGPAAAPDEHSRDDDRDEDSRKSVRFAPHRPHVSRNPRHASRRLTVTSAATNAAAATPAKYPSDPRGPHGMA